MICGTATLISSTALAQSVCLPAPRLLTMMPMGGQVGASVEIVITGDNFEDTDELSFSDKGITATRKLDASGKPVPNQYVVSIADNCPAGVHEARVMTRLGVSSSRVFNVGSLPEVTRTAANASLKTAMPLTVDSICNAVMTAQVIDYYSFEATKGQRIVVDCAATGIDSKLNPVVIVADQQGADLMVQRRGGAISFTAPDTGSYVVKLHDLTFKGGSQYFYRLALQSAVPGELVPRLPSTRTVSSFSWPPPGLIDEAPLAESEPNNQHALAQKIALPCDIRGSFFPAADVDTFEFSASKGDVWWVEVASERLGLPTDPSIVVQHVTGEGADEKRNDVVELSDIASPMKVSSNGYSYDGPPYDAGSTDILGKVEIKEDGIHRLQLRDLFGGTRNDPLNVYRLIIRKAIPDFAIVGWALHMNLRNGDRNALSKPIALRGGTTMPIEVVVVRRDGFDGEIDLVMEGLPDGVTAAGIKIPSGKTSGIMLVTAEQNAPRALVSASFYGRATIDGNVVTRPCHMASMQWPIPDASQEVPVPRLLADVPVSVCGSEFAPITIAPIENTLWEVTVSGKLTLPLVHTRRCEFSGDSINLRTFGPGFEGVPAFDVSLNDETSEVVLDLAALKTPPGDYTIAFYGSAVARYRYNVEAVTTAEVALKQAQQKAMNVKVEAQSLTELSQTVPDDQKVTAARMAQEAVARQKAAEAAVVLADKLLKDVTARAQPKDIVDIVVSTPIRIRVNPAEKK
ncbi:MAG: PPC domain-containing protein [Planctomycetota bacterium]|nr:PPC domain-containing protein [Planctomycetota bacterium]